MKFLWVLFLVITQIFGCHDRREFMDRLAGGEGQTLAVYGTSLTAYGTWSREVAEIMNAAYTGNLTVVNLGKGSMASDWGEVNYRNVMRANPDVLIMEFAINDAYEPYGITVAQARIHLKTIILRVKYYLPDCDIILMVTNPCKGAAADARPDLVAYYDMWRTVARDEGLVLIDQYPAWHGLMTDDPPLFDEFIPDGIHPNIAGNSAVVVPCIITTLCKVDRRIEKLVMGIGK